MNEPSRTTPDERDVTPPAVGPAVSRRALGTEPSSLGAVDAPLPPFIPSTERGSVAPHPTVPATEPQAGSDDPEELLVLDTPVMQEEPAEPEAAEALPEWLSWVAEEEPELEPSTEMEWLETVAEDVTPAGVEIAEEPVPGESITDVMEPPAPAPEPLPALGAVAERLEQIARSLRERSPDQLLGGADGVTDPLEILITGYALGYSEGRHYAGERADGE